MGESIRRYRERVMSDSGLSWHQLWASLTDAQRLAVESVVAAFDGDEHKVCEAMGMEWDGNMGWNR